MKKAIVFGASGLVGSQLVQLLIEDVNYDKIVLFNRRPLAYNSSKIDEIILNFDEIEKFPDQIADGHVFCTIGTTIKKAKSIEAFVKIDYDIPYKITKIRKKCEFLTFLIADYHTYPMLHIN